MLLVAAALAADPVTDPPVVPVPAWETGQAGFGQRFGRAGAYGVGGGLAVAATGVLLMATTSCDDCFEPPAQWWIGLAGVGLGATAVALSTPAAVAGPVIRGAALKKAGFNVVRGPGWVAVGFAAGAGASAIVAALLPEESPTLGVTSGVLVGGSLIAAGVQTGLNNQARRETVHLDLRVVPAPNGLALVGQF